MVHGPVGEMLHVADDREAVSEEEVEEEVDEPLFHVSDDEEDPLFQLSDAEWEAPLTPDEMSPLRTDSDGLGCAVVLLMNVWLS